ncbi:FtsX-like permease family protein [Kribbella sp. NBC_01245]|uniref:ABC transporter permease n=1 Tax=Kribbella sp. NBC_01245 TaxID=2903578 RepID=UPI002E285FC9|nr:FtsX-like permease family protein [Kribbella sp. NBC_01245]
MSALGRVVRSGVARRRVPTIVIGLATLMAVAASVLGVSLLVASRAPFEKAFARQQGAHLSAQFDAAKASAAKITAGAAAAEASAGPFGVATITPEMAPGRFGAPLSVVGRADPSNAAVDRVSLTSGRWATGPGEIVVSTDAALPQRLGIQVTLAGGRTLKVVGVARSVSRTADGWVVPSEIASLGLAGYQMLYRFNGGSVDADAVTAGLPVVGTQSWLTLKKTAERDTALFVPFLMAFGLLGLVMSVLIVANVVAGTVGASLRRIGILKAIGFTPAQVVRAYLAQALLPATVGTALGVVVGNLLAIPVMAQTTEAYGTTPLAVTPWVNVVVVVLVLGVVALAAWASAWRAGRLRTVDAIAVGRTPHAGRGVWASRLTSRLRVPRTVSLGLARPFARPARTLAMGAAIVFGTTAVTFSVGLTSSLSEVLSARAHDVADVTIGAGGGGGIGGQREPGPNGPGAPEKEPDPVAIAAAIAAQPGTRAHYGAATTEATVPGVTGAITVIAFTGDASWGGYRMISGRWFSQVGEAVVPTPLLTATGTRVGDTLTLKHHGKSYTVRIVGEVFDTSNDGLEVFADTATFAGATGLTVRSHHIAVDPGVDVASYTTSLNKALDPLGVTANVGSGENGSSIVVTLNALAAMLTLMLVVVAALGVLNGVVLDTRERIQELGIHKALGMTPRQTIAMVITSVTLTGLAAGLIGVPLGIALHGWVMPAMGNSAGLVLPPSILAVYQPPELALLLTGGLPLAILGALLPATWAARTPTTTALRTE